MEKHYYIREVNGWDIYKVEAPWGSFFRACKSGEDPAELGENDEDSESAIVDWCANN